jgi:uncharacterized membrane protein
MLLHSLGVFVATFLYSLGALAWVDRERSGIVPLFSGYVVAGLLLLSMPLFSRLMKGVSDLQITNVLHLVGDKGRAVIRETFQRLDEETAGQSSVAREVGRGAELGPAVQTLMYFGGPRTIAKIDIDDLVRWAQQAGAVNERTAEQDPKYPIRLLVDIAIKALSPAINDPTTAVQAIDQIEDLLRRLGRRDLDAGQARDAKGVLRLIFPMPTWEDYLALAFDEVRNMAPTRFR